MTIPSTNTKLLLTEDWKKIYQSFRNADFKSYDFETLRRVMIQYLRENYPEDFNDYTDSSEYIALIDLIAFMGQNLSFRIDLNARENFLETAQRRDSILRLAQLVSYVPKRNIPSSGFLKLVSIATTDSVIDNNGVNLANSAIGWSDNTNPNWYGQFIAVFNSCLSDVKVFGSPNDRATINGVLCEQYQINSSNTDLPIYGFSKNIDGTTMNFEIVPTFFPSQTMVQEQPPLPGSNFSILYKNDNGGPSSPNTGFFAHFKQGEISFVDFDVDIPTSNQIIGVNTTNINDTDVWLWNLSSTGNYSTLWSKTDSLVGNNIIYNSLNKSVRNIYSVSSRDQDQIDLNFADGVFGNLPSGKFRLFYRQSNGLTYTIKPENMSGIVINLPYKNKIGQNHTLTLIFGLQYIVNNSSGTESNKSIQSNAPQSYYLQNRMVTAEDYNIAPLTKCAGILKVKSINRVSSGISKYFDLSDVSGKYSKTNIFAADGILYKNSYEEIYEFNFNTNSDIYRVIKTELPRILKIPSLKSFYVDKYSKISLEDLQLEWVQSNKISGQGRGYFTINKSAQSVGTYSANNLRYITSQSLIKFVPPTGKYFLPNGTIVSTQSSKTLNYIWIKVINVIDDGSNFGSGTLDGGIGPIVLSGYIDSTARPVFVIPKFIDIFSTAFENELISFSLNKRNFGITIDQYLRTWNVIEDSNIDLINPWSLSNQKNTEGLNKNSSWLIAFSWNGLNYKIRYRLVDFIFESEKETAFFIDSNSINFDFTSNKVIKDQITVLSFNSSYDPPSAINTYTLGSLGGDYLWQIDSGFTELDGYVDPRKVKISFYDYDNIGQVLDPDAFNRIIEPLTTSTVTGYYDKFVYFEKSTDGLRYQLTDSEMFKSYPSPEFVSEDMRIDGDLYYFYNDEYNVVNRYSAVNSIDSINSPWVYESKYIAFPGRSNLKFHYVHNSGQDRRLDPGKSNIIDVYLLTSSYNNDYRTWINSQTGSEPLPPTISDLESNYFEVLQPIKTISDEMVFHSAKYKVLFGASAVSELQATFKAVRNPNRILGDNNLKTSILSAIQQFFSLDNWDFGQSFYFSELSTYVMNLLTPDITNFVIVPKFPSNSFGSLYEVTCLTYEIFISGAGINDIEIIDAITPTQIKSGSIITSSSS
jgi:hypothetical protein